MKYLVMGHSGSGKSTLTKLISEIKHIPLLYLDCVHFESDWKARDDEQAKKIVKKFLNSNDSWVIDGNYFKFELEERVKQADVIIYLNFNRIECLIRAYKRYFKYKGKERESISKGCYETMDNEFIGWILKDGRSKKRIEKFNEIIKTPNKQIVVIKNQKQLDKFINALKSGNRIEDIM